MSYSTNNEAIATAIPSEQDVLGALIAGNATLADIPHFSADWFAEPIHASIYNAIKEQADNEAPITIAALAQVLGPCSQDAGGMEPGCALEDVGGPGYLVDLAARKTPPIDEAERAVISAWLLRKLGWSGAQ